MTRYSIRLVTLTANAMVDKQSGRQTNKLVGDLTKRRIHEEGRGGGGASSRSSSPPPSQSWCQLGIIPQISAGTAPLVYKGNIVQQAGYQEFRF